jgi:hypothetical protein
MRKISLLAVFLFVSLIGSSQSVPVNPANTGIYSFIDELSNDGIIDVVSVTKPYYRTDIAKWLQEADTKKQQLSQRQQKELAFYLKDYGKELHADRNFKRRLDLLYYKDTLFSATINPILGLTKGKYGEQDYTHRYNGIDAFGYIGKHVGIWASFRDNFENEPLTKPAYLNQELGKNNMHTSSGYEYDEMRGGISYGWSWGSLELAKDQIQWGSGYNGTNILSGRTPSFPYVMLTLSPVKWFKFKYFHGTLVSDVVDSSKTYNIPGAKFDREVYRNKYMAANMFTLIPTRWLEFSFGNSTIYSDNGIHLTYLIPFMFYRSSDRSTSSNKSNGIDNNSLLFFNLNLKPVKHLSVYSSVFIDEMGISRMFSKTENTNEVSVKVGGNLTNWPVNNVQATVEYTRTNPFCYRHYVQACTYESNNYLLGHYLGDNSDEIYAALTVKPIRTLYLKAAFTKARKGQVYSTDWMNTPQRRGLPFMDEERWKSQVIKFAATYQPINDLYINFGVESSDISGADVNLYTPKFLQGKTTTVYGGINIGF